MNKDKTCDMVFVKDDCFMPSDWAYYCSECKRRIAREPVLEIHFCPNCGAKVKNWTNKKSIWVEDFVGLK